MVKRLIIGLVLLISVTTVSAQRNLPEAILNRIFEDLRGRAGGVAVQAATWNWSQRTYDDASLGCPREGQMYAQTRTVGYQVMLTSLGNTYDYRAYANTGAIFLCSINNQAAEDEIDDATPTAAPQEALNPRAITAENADQIGEITRIQGTVSDIVAWSPSGKTLAAIFHDPAEAQRQGVFVYDANNLNAPPFRIRADYPVNAIGYFDYHNTIYIALGGVNGNAFITPIEPVGYETQPIQPRKDMPIINAISASFDGTILGTATGVESDLPILGGDYFGTVSSYAVSLWNSKNGRLWNVVEADSPVMSLAFVPNARTLFAFGTQGGVLAVTDYQTVPEPVVLIEGGATITDLAFSKNGQRLVASDSSGTITLWDTSAPNPQSWTLIETFTTESGQPLLSVDITADSRLIVAGGGDAEAATPDTHLYLWDVDSATQIAQIAGHAHPIRSVSFNHDGSQIASAGGRGIIHVWGLP